MPRRRCRRPMNDDNSKRPTPADSAHSAFGPGLSRFDGYRIAVMLLHGSRHRVVTGTARFKREKSLGNVLRIRVEDDEFGDPEVVICEDDWTGQFAVDRLFGCDYFILLQAGNTPHDDDLHD